MLNNLKNISFKNVFNYFGAYIRINKAGLDKSRLKDYPTDEEARKSKLVAQFKWRYDQVLAKSPVCLSEGKCKDCSCETPEKFWESHECQTCYPKWMNLADWNEFKSLNK